MVRGGPSDQFWARSTAMTVPAGHQEMAKKVNFILQHGKVFLFLLRPTCYLSHTEEEQSITVKSRTPELPSSVHSSSTYVTILPLSIQLHTHRVQKSKQFSKKSTLKKA